MVDRMLAEKIEAVRAQLLDLPNRMRTSARVVAQTGMLFEMRPSGLRAALGALATGSRNPSLIFSLHAANTPDKVALLWRDRRLTYRELDHRMNRAAAGLKRRGFRRGSSVILMMRNRPEFLEVQLGAGRFGAAAVSVSWRSTPSELVYLAQNCGAKAIVLDRKSTRLNSSHRL